MATRLYPKGALKNMKFVWRQDGDQINSELLFLIENSYGADTLELCAADSYTVVGDGRVISFGPERCAAGYSRIRKIPISGVSKIEIRVLSFGITNYSVDYQQPYVGFRLLKGDDEVYSSSETTVAYAERRRILNMPKYSTQRGFAQGFDLSDDGLDEVVLCEVAPPVILPGSPDVCDYKAYSFKKISDGVFDGFDEIRQYPFNDNLFEDGRALRLSVDELIERSVKERRRDEKYSLDAEKCGFLSFKIEAEEDGELLAVFEEITPEGRWIFRRAKNNDFVYVKFKAGVSEVRVSEPYAMKLLRIISTGKAKILPYLVAVENSRAECVRVSGDERVVKVFEAAKNTFMQNAVDIFMDCPGRERAGWLCDSYFTAIAERLFTGKNDIERAYLENYLLASTPELPEGMLPMCFPAEHKSGRYIPNWAMWFVIELHHRLMREGDRELVDRAYDKVMGVVKFFDKYKNEYGLLENLESWVFIEWSICNDPDYVKGVNYPSNMLYAYMLDKVSEMYGDEKYAKEAENIRKCIYRLSFNGKFYVDNAERVDGRLVNIDEHLSETCQYYALFFGLPVSDDFCRMMTEEFGPLRTDAYPEVGRSNMFIGNYLRFIWLLSIGQNERVLNECVEYFAKMADTTGTLWEHDRSTASCNHGFASSAAAIILEALVGYQTVAHGAPVFKSGHIRPSGYDVNVEFNYGKK